MYHKLRLVSILALTIALVANTGVIFSQRASAQDLPNYCCGPDWGQTPAGCDDCCEIFCGQFPSPYCVSGCELKSNCDTCHIS